jgi:hypothetical protein
VREEPLGQPFSTHPTHAKGFLTMSVLQEALDFVFDKAETYAAREEKDVHPRLVSEVPSDGRTVTIEYEGKLTEHRVPPPLRKHKVESVEDLVEAAKVWGTQSDGPEHGAGTVIWIDGNQVVLVPDDSDRRESITLPLTKSAVFLKLEALGKGNGVMDQATLVRLLRRELRKANEQSVILAAVRRIKWRSSDSGHASISHGNESLGRTIESEVSGASDIPETLTVPTNVFKNPGEEDVQFTVGLDLEIDTGNQRFLLSPMPDEIELAIAFALRSIRDRITKELPDVAVFFGTP